MAKKDTKRKRSKYPNLDPSLNLRTRWEEVNDVASYANKLTKEEKKWMNKFMGEYNNAALDYNNLENNLHNTQALKKACTDRNNARNRDIYSRSKAANALVSIEDYKKDEGALEAFDNLNNDKSEPSEPSDGSGEL